VCCIDRLNPQSIADSLLAAKRTLKRRAHKIVSDWALDVSLDHLVGLEQRLRDLDAERLSGLQI
jgi:hypothetical protein